MGTLKLSMPQLATCSQAVAIPAIATRAVKPGLARPWAWASCWIRSSTSRLALAMAVVPSNDLRWPSTVQLGDGRPAPSSPASPSPQAITNTPLAAAAGCWGQNRANRAVIDAP